jgi:hypothetical protein
MRLFHRRIYALFRKAIVSIHNLVPAPAKTVPVVKTVVSAPVAVPTVLASTPQTTQQ